MILSPDAYLYENGQYLWTAERSAAAWERVDRELEVALQSPEYRALILMVGVPGSGKSTWLETHHDPRAVYLDATMTRREVRTKYVTMAQAVQKPVAAVVLMTDFLVCLQRNGVREASRQVPWETMDRFQRQLKQEPVLREEGFSHIEVVW